MIVILMKKESLITTERMKQENLFVLTAVKRKRRMTEMDAVMTGRKQKPVFFECSKCHSIKRYQHKGGFDNEIKEGENNLLGGVPPCEDGKLMSVPAYEVLENNCKTEGKNAIYVTSVGQK